MITPEEHQKRLQKYIDAYRAHNDFLMTLVTHEEKPTGTTIGSILTYSLPSDPVELQKYIDLQEAVKKALEELNA